MWECVEEVTCARGAACLAAGAGERKGAREEGSAIIRYDYVAVVVEGTWKTALEDYSREKINIQRRSSKHITEDICLT